MEDKEIHAYGYVPPETPQQPDDLIIEGFVPPNPPVQPPTSENPTD